MLFVPGEVHILASKKKIEFFQPLADVRSETAAGAQIDPSQTLTFPLCPSRSQPAQAEGAEFKTVLHVREKGAEEEKQIAEIVDIVRTTGGNVGYMPLKGDVGAFVGAFQSKLAGELL